MSVAVAVGVPIYTGATHAPRPASATPPLRVIAEILRDNLDLKGSVPQVVNAAAEVLGLELDEDATLMARARQCHLALNGDGSWAAGRPGSSRARPRTPAAAPAAAVTVAASLPEGMEVAEGQPLDDTAPAPALKCRGVEFGFQCASPYLPSSRAPASHEGNGCPPNATPHALLTPPPRPVALAGTTIFTASGSCRTRCLYVTSVHTTSMTRCMAARLTSSTCSTRTTTCRGG